MLTACAASTSVLTTRPWGPEPLIEAISSPVLAAMRRASGDEKMRVLLFTRGTREGVISPSL